MIPRSLSVVICLLGTILLLLITQAAASPGHPLSGKTILWVDSYHKGYPWSDELELGIRKTLWQSGVQLSIFRMNTKLNDSVEFGEEAGKKAFQEVERVKPDLVIATDDNAQKYLVVPYLKNTDLPVVFSGVNWDASEYGYPCKNITGMVEIDQVDALIAHMQRDAGGTRVGFLSADVETSRKAGKNINDRFLNKEMKTYMVKTFEEFKKQFLLAQEEVDMLIIYNNVGIKGWNDHAAENFVIENTKIPTGTLLKFLEKLAVYTLGKSAEEQGEYAARTALQILSGSSPSDFPLVTNKNVKLTANMRIAEAAGIVFPLSVLKTADIIGKEVYTETAVDKSMKEFNFEGKSVVWVDSYHHGYEWSDGIEKGITHIFAGKGIRLTIIRMDTKRRQSPDIGREEGVRAMKQIAALQPDAIIASDDNAQKYLVVPYLMESGIPVVFCGVNWDASMYGYPTTSITGMVEVEPIEALAKALRRYAKGDRIGYLSGDADTERKIVDIYNRKIFNNRLIPYFSNSLEQFTKNFIRAQQEVDMLILPNYAGINDWDSKRMETFIRDNIRIPTGGVFDYMAKFVIFTFSKDPQEQGEFAAKTIMEILSGTSPKDIPIGTNKREKTIVNLTMAEAAGIVIPVSFLKEVDSVIGQETFLPQQ